jgi:hypothetical protein
LRVPMITHVGLRPLPLHVYSLPQGGLMLTSGETGEYDPTPSAMFLTCSSLAYHHRFGWASWSDRVA